MMRFSIAAYTDYEDGRYSPKLFKTMDVDEVHVAYEPLTIIDGRYSPKLFKTMDIDEVAYKLVNH